MNSDAWLEISRSVRFSDTDAEQRWRMWLRWMQMRV